jgi:two-component system cell cycle sensor histidine kinase/response regulator CckA
MLNRLIGDDVVLTSTLSPDLATINADPSQVEQVLMNLAINARDAMPTGGKISVTTANVEVDEVHARQPPFVVPGRYVRLTVTDTGTGMNAETQSHIFEPFFSTKAPGRGTGLGLSTVWGIVNQRGGSIAVYSEPNLGTTFKVYFQRHGESAVTAPPMAQTSVRGGRETILLVDDAAALRKLTRRLLQDCGYTVLESGDPAEALRIAAEYPGELPLMITDVVMPGFSGSVLAEKLATSRPETKVLYASGYTDEAVLPLPRPGQHYAFLEKPFTREALLLKVRELLDWSPRSSHLQPNCP